MLLIILFFNYGKEEVIQPTFLKLFNVNTSRLFLLGVVKKVLTCF